MIGDQVRGRDAGVVVILGDDRRHAGAGGFLQQFDVIEAARRDRGA